MTKDGVVMSSQITHKQSSNINHPLVHILDTCSLIFSGCALFYSLLQPHHVMASHPFYSLLQPYHVMASHPSPGDNHQSMEVVCNTWPSKKCPVKLNQLHMHQGFPVFFYLSHSLQHHSSVAQGHLHTIHPASPRSTSYMPSTYFRHQHPLGHTILSHPFHMPKPSQYSLIRSTINSLSIPALLHTCSFLTIHL